MRTDTFVIPIDLGTDSVRSVVADTSDGELQDVSEPGQAYKNTMVHRFTAA